MIAYQRVLREAVGASAGTPVSGRFLLPHSSSGLPAKRRRRPPRSRARRRFILDLRPRDAGCLGPVPERPAFFVNPNPSPSRPRLRRGRDGPRAGCLIPLPFPAFLSPCGRRSRFRGRVLRTKGKCRHCVLRRATAQCRPLKARPKNDLQTGVDPRLVCRYRMSCSLRHLDADALCLASDA